MSGYHDAELADSLEGEAIRHGRRTNQRSQAWAESLLKQSDRVRTDGAVRSFTLTRRNFEVLEAINELMDEHGWPPSMDEIGERCGGINRPSVMRHLERLERACLIVRQAEKPRALRVVGRPYLPSRRRETP